jgi:hypothetical protein
LCQLRPVDQLPENEPDPFGVDLLPPGRSDDGELHQPLLRAAGVEIVGDVALRWKVRDLQDANLGRAGLDRLARDRLAILPPRVVVVRDDDQVMTFDWTELGFLRLPRAAYRSRGEQSEIRQPIGVLRSLDPPDRGSGWGRVDSVEVVGHPPNAFHGAASVRTSRSEVLRFEPVLMTENAAVLVHECVRRHDPTRRTLRGRYRPRPGLLRECVRRSQTERVHDVGEPASLALTADQGATVAAFGQLEGIAVVAAVNRAPGDPLAAALTWFESAGLEGRADRFNRPNHRRALRAAPGRGLLRWFAPPSTRQGRTAVVDPLSHFPEVELDDAAEADAGDDALPCELIDAVLRLEQIRPALGNVLGGSD